MSEILTVIGNLPTSVDSQGPVFEAIGRNMLLSDIEDAKEPESSETLMSLIKSVISLEQKASSFEMVYQGLIAWIGGVRKYRYLLCAKSSETSLTCFDEAVKSFERGLGGAVRKANYAILEEPRMSLDGTPHIFRDRNTLSQGVLITVSFDADNNLPEIGQFKSGLETFSSSLDLEMVVNGTSRDTLGIGNS